ncbi:MAG: hypothetical protein H7039_02630 [Bryobacteraceae bacterium]|nr:hypothetical protein [Bryobacteraceae bacterium]
MTIAAIGTAATPDYFPLQTGNSWAYRVSQGRLPGRSAAVNVGEQVSAGGRQYFKVQFFERDFLVRQTEDGSLVSWNSDAKSEDAWLPLGAAEGQSLQTSFDDCAKTAAVRSRAAKITTEIGDVNEALELRYTANCADAGTTVQYFAPYIGLVRGEETSIAGPVVYELLYSRTGITNIDSKINAFTLATDSSVYPRGQTREATARLTLRASEAVKLSFSSGQSTDLTIINDKGESAYTWSADKIFIAVMREEQVGPGEKTWLMNFPVSQLPPGKYTARGRLTTLQEGYSAIVTFEVR